MELIKSFNGSYSILGQASRAKPKAADRESKSQFRKNAVLNYVADVTVKLHPVQQKLIEVCTVHVRIW